MAADTERILNGEEPLPPSTSKNYEGNTPDNFSDWAIHNLKRIDKARQNGTLPYFLKDNQKYLDKAIPPTLVHLYDVIAKYQYTDPQLAARATEIKAKMLEIFENNDFGLDVPKAVFESIVNDNEFKNQFQVGRSMGALDSTRTTGEIEQYNRRLVASHRMFSTTDGSLFDLKDSPFDDSLYMGPQFARDEYEKYGHLLDRNKTDAFIKQVTQYRSGGGIQVRFKRDSVKDRCTWTLSDSLISCREGAYMQPTLVSNPGVESFNRLFGDYVGHAYGRSNTIDKFLNSKDSVSTMVQKMGNDYFELQYHGKLTLDDVQSLVFSRHPNADFPHLVQKLIDKGIEIWYYDDSVKKVVKYKP